MQDLPTEHAPPTVPPAPVPAAPSPATAGPTAEPVAEVHTVVPAVPPAPAAGPDVEPVAEDRKVVSPAHLDALEGELAAVEAALATIDRLCADATDDDPVEVADRILAAVPADRFEPAAPAV